MSKQRILIIGAAGGLAKILINLISRQKNNFEITAIDSRTIEDRLESPNIHYKRVRYTRNNFERLFRQNEFDTVFHLGRISHVQNSKSLIATRLDQNIIGTQNILNLSLKHNTKKVVILSTYHVYGALADNPVYLTEDSPLRASIKYPDLRDVVEMDHISTNWMWKNKEEIQTVILRPCNIIGPQVKNTISRYLSTPLVPLPIDFNPMFQFIHEYDMANILFETIEKVPTGVYNVAPSETISIKKAKGLVGENYLPTPSFLLEGLSSLVSTPIWRFPDYLIDYLKFSSIIDNSEIIKILGEDIFQFNTEDTLDLLRIS
ncbi:MAG: NAD-dependent epimerase/dehydratase family protein [Bacteriovoracaceae bacterium]